MAMLFTAEEVQQLFHNKFVAILGDSIQRSVYKDLVLLLQKDLYLSNSQLRAKGEFSFEQDFLVEGGRLAELNNGTKYREVRQYRTENHLVRFYFLTRVYSDYLESVLADFKAGPQPDVLIINSCVWDVSRYGLRSMEDYKVNLEKMFTRMDEVLLPDCLMLWNMAMPLARKIKGGFLIPELQHLDKTLRKDIIEGNFYSATFAACHKFDVLDLHYHFRFDGQDRLKDGVHWNQIVHRKITQLLLAHIADAWGVEIPKKKSMEGACWTESIADALEWCFGGNTAPDTGSTMFRIDDRCIRGRPPDCDMFRSDRVIRMERHAWEHPREEYYSYPESFSDLVFNENSGYCAPQSYSSAPSYQKRQRKEANFANCGPPVSSYNGLEPFFYDDSPALNSSFSSGYTDFEEPNDHCANGPYAGMNKPFANCDFPLYNLGNFPHHTEYPLSERRNEGDNYVMRRPLKSRESVAPYYRPRNNRYCRY